MHTPTPSAVLGASNRELEECIGPLGLMEVRRKALQQMSHDFFAKVGSPPCLPLPLTALHCNEEKVCRCFGSGDNHGAEYACRALLANNGVESGG